MSTEIKPGQVWEYKRTSDTEPVTVTEVRDGTVAYVFAADQSDGDMSIVAFRKMRRLVTDVPPLDPSRVKAGDTVTLDSDELVANVTGRVTDIQHDHGAWTIYLTLGVMGHSTPFVVGVGTSWRLVAHAQPAPEPEPADGTVGHATVTAVESGASSLNMRVMRILGGWAGANAAVWDDADDRFRVTDFVPDEPRQLPDRHEVHELIANGDDCCDTTDAVMALLRGESR